MQVSWIEPDELRDLANMLLEPDSNDRSASIELRTLPEPSTLPGPLLNELPPDASAPAPMPAQIPTPELDQIRERLRAIRDRAQGAGLLPSPAPLAQPEEPQALPSAPSDSKATEEPAPQAVANQPEEVVSKTQKAHFLPLEGSISERLDSYARWAIDYSESEDLLIIDDHGAPLWGIPTRNDLAVSAMLALETGQRTSAGSFNSEVILHSRMNEHKELTIFRCITRYGIVSIASISNHALPDETVQELRDALILAIDEAKV